MTRLREPLTFFVDRSLGGKIVVGALRAAGVVAHAHDERFDKTDPDEKWLARCGRDKRLALPTP